MDGDVFGVMCAMVSGMVNEVFSVIWCASYWWGSGSEVCGVMGRVVSGWYFVWYGEWVGMFSV